MGARRDLGTGLGTGPREALSATCWMRSWMERGGETVGVILHLSAGGMGLTVDAPGAAMGTLAHGIANVMRSVIGTPTIRAGLLVLR